jgi:hypothetical protein
VRPSAAGDLVRSDQRPGCGRSQGARTVKGNGRASAGGRIAPVRLSARRAIRSGRWRRR